MRRRNRRREAVTKKRWLRVVLASNPYVIVFVASACGLILEIVAARILAPKIGVSIYTWTSIIGVVLAGISAGNYLGGRVADRYPSSTTLGFILLAAGLASLSVLPLVDLVSEAFQQVPILARIILLTAALFFIPSAILGMVTPMVIKLNLQDLGRTGNVVGQFYAVSTVGAIFGVFMTGFVFVQWIGTRQTILMVALVLVAMSLVFGNLWRARLPSISVVTLFVALVIFSAASGQLNSGCLRESNYFCIRVTDDTFEGHGVKALHLDKLAHSYVSPDTPSFLVYGYQKVSADLVTLIAQQKPDFRVLFIGGGGYTMPRFLEEVYPQSSLEVIEIDPEVTSVAFDHLGLQRGTRMLFYHEDARMAVPKLAHGRYDLVFGDAYSDLSVPYQLTTQEFNQQVQDLLTKDGIYVVNVTDKFQSGEFARAMVNTLRSTFPNVYLLRENEDWSSDRREPLIIAASNRSLSLQELQRASIQLGRGEPVSHFLPQDAIDTWLGAKKRVLLTDNYAPVDNMLATVYLDRSRLDRERLRLNREQLRLLEAGAHNNSGAELEVQGRFQDAIQEYDKAIRIAPRLAAAYINRGKALRRLGQTTRALNDYNEAILLDPDFAPAYVNRGVLYIELKRDLNALDDMDQAIRLDPSLTGAYVNRGSIYDRSGKYQRAVEDYGEALRLNPGYSKVYALRALVHTTLGRDDLAEADFAQAVRLGEDASQLRQSIDQRRNQR